MTLLHPETADGAKLSRNHRTLDATAAARVTTAAAATTCTACLSREFDVGDAVELGSIWPNEELESYMVGLTCRGCGRRTGIRLREQQFLSG